MRFLGNAFGERSTVEHVPAIRVSRENLKKWTLPGQLTTQSPLRVKASRAALVPSPRRRSCSVRAAATGPGPKPKGDLIQNVRQGCDDFLQRYDVLSCGFGALCCTSVFVAQGQSPADALWITAAATVTGLVANELFFDNST